MIIKEVKLSSGFLFIKETLNIITNEGKINLEEKFDSKLVQELNIKLKDFEINSAEDFTKLKEKLKDLDNEKYLIIEKAIINNIKNFWSFFDPTITQVPRPMCVVYEKEKGIKKFIVFSLNANNFDAVITSCRKVTDFLKKKDISKLKDEDILMLIKEGIDKEHELVNFELRIGVVLDNFENGNYIYNGYELDENKQFEFVSKLIEKYSVVYVENPFNETNLEVYKKLNNKFKSICLICLNSKINEYSEGINKKCFNTLIAKYLNISSFKTEALFFKDQGLNTIVEQNPDIIDVVVGLGIPLIKIEDDKNVYQISRKIKNISDEIVKFKSKK